MITIVYSMISLLSESLDMDGIRNRNDISWMLNTHTDAENLAAEAAAPVAHPPANRLQAYGHMQNGALQSLPPELLSKIQEFAFARARDRVGFASQSRYLAHQDQAFLNRDENKKIAFRHVENAVNQFSRQPIEQFRSGVTELFRKNAFLKVDFSDLNAEQAVIVLDQLRERSVAEGEIKGLALSVNLDEANGYLLLPVNNLISEIRNANNHAEIDFQFHCISNDSLRQQPPDVANFENLTHLDLSRCRSMLFPPDLSGNPQLKQIDMSDCQDMESPPDVSQNPLLRCLKLAECSFVNVPDLRHNPMLQYLDLSTCFQMTTAPDISHNPELRYLDLSQCHGLNNTPDYSSYPNLRYIDPNHNANGPNSQIVNEYQNLDSDTESLHSDMSSETNAGSDLSDAHSDFAIDDHDMEGVLEMVANHQLETHAGNH